MRREPALSSFPPGAGALSIIITVRVLFSPFSASAPWLASQSFTEITAKDIGRGARPYPERARGWRIWRSGNIHEKAIDGPHQLTLFSSVPRTRTHTYLATASDYSGRFPPSTGNPGFEGCKKTNSSNTTTIRTLHLSTTSRDANPPRGEQQKVQSTTKTASPSKAQKYYYPMISIPNHHHHYDHLRHHRIQTRSFNTLVGTRAESVFSIYTHKHTHTHHIHIPPDFSRPRKELSRSREKSEGFTNAPLQDSNKPRFLSLPAQIFSVFLLPLLLSHIPWSSWDGLGGRAPGVHRHLFPISSQFFNFLIYSSFHFLSFLDLIICTFLDNFLNWVFSISSHPQPFSFLFFHPFDYMCACSMKGDWPEQKIPTDLQGLWAGKDWAGGRMDGWNDDWVHECRCLMVDKVQGTIDTPRGRDWGQPTQRCQAVWGEGTTRCRMVRYGMHGCIMGGRV